MRWDASKSIFTTIALLSFSLSFLLSLLLSLSKMFVGFCFLFYPCSVFVLTLAALSFSLSCSASSLLSIFLIALRPSGEANLVRPRIGVRETRCSSLDM